ncbi:replication initiation protein [Lactobacillus sp. ESL0679]|uniref:replication initiation protein n=1 Tax=Lactobacillus sp. ESL0679 TaxID=2983209 RepID=UPI0023F8B7AC|nr:replication initiation protein [Lactobacillus sp. ESL0679]MDF7683239.1 replication initiation protein [Lactobacillus sp. ESL0679]
MAKDETVKSEMISDSDFETGEKQNLMPAVKFNNEIAQSEIMREVNKLPELESNLFFLSVAQLYQEHNHIVKFDSSQIKDVLNYQKHVTNKYWLNKLTKGFERLLSIKQKITRKNIQTGRESTTVVNLFRTATVYHDDLSVEIQVSPEFEYLFNDISNWTRFSLYKYVDIHSVYSKRLFVNLKQYRVVGHRTYGIEEFKEALSIPKSYKPGNIQQKVLDVVSEEMASVFFDFKITKNYLKGVRGRKLGGYTFSWRPEKNSQREIYANVEIQKTWALYSIRSSNYLSTKQKFRAIDRLRGQRLGTTEKNYKRHHPTTYFLEPEDENREKRSVFVRGSLEAIKHYKATELRTLIELYEDMNENGLLYTGDIEDLTIMEYRLLMMKIKSVQKKPENAEKINNNDGTLTSEILDFNNLGQKDLSEARLKAICKEAVKQQFGRKRRKIDHRLLEDKEEFWDDNKQ